MYCSPDMALWQGRVDQESTPAFRWHQLITAWDQISELKDTPTLLGFACDTGVIRNQGRAGARKGPVAIRQCLASMAYHHSLAPFDAGDIVCEDDRLEAAQQTLAEQVQKILDRRGRLVVLGGGHEVAWGSFIGLTAHLASQSEEQRVGIINFDSHFDLRAPSPRPSSGTAFRQIATWCEERHQRYNYFAIGINPATNTKALYDFAHVHQARWIEDIYCTQQHLSTLIGELTGFLAEIDVLYVTLCLDVFPASYAPGVSAPAAVGVDPVVIIKLLQALKLHCRQNGIEWLLSDIAECNPEHDIDNRTARLAARMVHEMIA